MQKDVFKGYFYILIGSTLWGVSSVVAKSLFNLGLPPAELVLVRLTLAALAIFLVLLFFNPALLRISLKDLPYFAILGFGGVAGMQYAYYYAISKIQVGPAILLQYLAPLWVALYALFFQNEPYARGKVISLILAFGGCYLLVGGYQFDLLRLNRAGILSGIISSLFFAFYGLYGERGLKKYDPWTLIFYGFGFGAILYWIILSPIKIVSAGYSVKIWMAFLYVAIFSTLVPFGLYFKGIERIRATRASITATWEPMVACFTAYFVLGEILSFLQLVGGIAVIAAIVILQLSREREPPSAPIEIRETSLPKEAVKLSEVRARGLNRKGEG